jgi:hypothetical protein
MKHFYTSLKSNTFSKTILITFLFFIVLMLIRQQASAQLSLGSRVWYDENDNGLIEANEPGLAGVAVKLYKDENEDGVADAGFTTLTTYTDGSGNYLFNNLAAGKYFIRVNNFSGYYMSTVCGGDPDNDIDHDNNGATQDLTNFRIYGQTITLAPNTEADGTGSVNTNTNNTYDIGTWKGNGLGDYVWLDNNGNGLQEAGEPGLANVTVRLRNQAGTLLQEVTTDAHGKYAFLDPMWYHSTINYMLEFVSPAGYTLSNTRQGNDNGRDSDPDMNGIVNNITVPEGTWNHTFDAGFKLGLGTLPVKLQFFTAMLNNDKVNLKWATSSEINLSHFSIERSFDGINYNEAGMVFAAGNSNDKLNYALTDNIATLQATVIYYRLRSVDVDGKSDVSEVKVIRVSNNDAAKVSVATYPNPVTNELRITIPSEWQNKKVVYEVVNGNGQLVKKSETGSSSQTETIQVSNLAPGFYVARVICDGQVAQQKIIKK